MNQNDIEIERKFLCRSLPANLGTYSRIEMRQGYIARDQETTVRIRQENDQFKLTVKSGRGLSRSESELDLNKKDFERLWPYTEHKRIEKTRYLIPLNSVNTAELDIYHNPALTELITIEVEFNSEENANSFTPPDWFGKEVTLDKNYLNSSLAVNGLPYYYSEENQ